MASFHLTTTSQCNQLSRSCLIGTRRSVHGRGNRHQSAQRPPLSSWREFDWEVASIFPYDSYEWIDQPPSIPLASAYPPHVHSDEIGPNLPSPVLFGSPQERCEDSILHPESHVVASENRPTSAQTIPLQFPKHDPRADERTSRFAVDGRSQDQLSTFVETAGPRLPCAYS